MSVKDISKELDRKDKREDYYAVALATVAKKLGHSIMIKIDKKYLEGSMTLYQLVENEDGLYLIVHTLEDICKDISDKHLY